MAESLFLLALAALLGLLLLVLLSTNESISAALESEDNILQANDLSLLATSALVDNRVVNDGLNKGADKVACIIIALVCNALHTTTAGETAESGLCDTFVHIAVDLLMAFVATLGRTRGGLALGASHV